VELEISTRNLLWKMKRIVEQQGKLRHVKMEGKLKSPFGIPRKSIFRTSIQERSNVFLRSNGEKIVIK